MKRAILVFFVIAIALIVRVAAYAATTTVTLAPRVEVQPARPIALGDIAKIDGSQEAIRKAGAMTVASGPMPGKSATLETSYVRLRLQAEVKGRFEVRGPQRVELVGKCLRFSPETLMEQAKQFVLDQLPQDGRVYEVLIDRPPREVVVASGATSELRPRLLNPTLKPGPKSVVVDVVVDQRVVASASVAISVKATADVLVATKAIRQGEALSPDNSAWDRRDVTKTPTAVTQAEGDITGWLAGRTLSAGALITTSDVAPPYVVHRGETVAVTVTCGRVTLRTTGEIRQDARTGDLVRVRPAVSGDDVQAKVLGPGVVAIAR